MSLSHALLIDDHPLFLAALSELLGEVRSEMAVVSVPDAGSARAALLEQRFDLVVVDLELPDVSGHELLHDVVHGDPTAIAVVVSGSNRLMDVHRALAAGANGYIKKSLPPREMKAALDSVMNGARVVPSGYSEERVAALTSLTQRQLDVLSLLDQGLTNQRIAERLSISPETVKSHLRILFETLDVNSRAGCISSARDLGLI